MFYCSCNKYKKTPCDLYCMSIDRLYMLVNYCEHLRYSGKTIGIANGCFDIFHAGHALFLKEASLHVDYLIVLLNSFSSIRKLKGPTRPINTCEDRYIVMSSIIYVDDILFFNSEEQLRYIIKILKPDFIIKSTEYINKNITGSEYANVLFVDHVDGKSTTKIFEELKKKLLTK